MKNVLNLFMLYVLTCVDTKQADMSRRKKFSLSRNMSLVITRKTTSGFQEAYVQPVTLPSRNRKSLKKGKR